MGPLQGLRVLDISPGGPGAFCSMMLSDNGAEVLRLDPVASSDPRLAERARWASMDAVLKRGARSVAIDLKNPDGVEAVLRLVERADALIEGFRPGVTERLGIGPEPCSARNPRLVYGRLTGWGQTGPLAQTPGHDINYISLSGALEPIGRSGKAPVPPLCMLGDFAGGGLLLAFGIVCAVREAQISGRGQVVDAAMVDGTALFSTLFHGMRAVGFWRDERGSNLLDTGAHFYEVYETADARFVSVGAIEDEMYRVLLERLGLADDEELRNQMDRSRWPLMRERLARVFKTKTRDEWVAVFEGAETCVTPVLSLAEAPAHPHNLARGTFVETRGLVQPAPAPRFSRTPGAVVRPPAEPGEHTDDALVDWGFSREEIEVLRNEGVIGRASAPVPDVASRGVSFRA